MLDEGGAVAPPEWAPAPVVFVDVGSTGLHDYRNALSGEITIEQFRDELDRLSQEDLGLTAEEFVHKYRDGELSDMPAVNEIAILAALGKDSRVRA
ncbi:MAG: hypothetical protein WKH64_15030 [Chloroflexia bacterium]